MTKTGTGKSKPLNEFQNLCLDVLRASKGNTTLDGIPNAPEVSGTDEMSFGTPTTTSTPSTSTAIPSVSTMKRSQSPKFPSPKKAKVADREYIPKKSEFLSSLTSIDLERNSREKDEHELRKYSLLLDVIKKEQELNLTPQQITFLRNAVADDNLSTLPTAHSIKNITEENTEILFVDELGNVLHSDDSVPENL